MSAVGRVLRAGCLPRSASVLWLNRARGKSFTENYIAFPRYTLASQGSILNARVYASGDICRLSAGVHLLGQKAPEPSIITTTIQTSGEDSAWLVLGWCLAGA